MKALVSGQAGIAIIIDGNAVYSIHLDSPERVPRSPFDLSYLLADATDVTELVETTQEHAADALELAWKQDRALHLILILLDRGADEEARQMAAECLEEFLKDPDVQEHVCNRLYAAPLPASADLLGSVLIAESTCAGRVNDLVEELGEIQSEVTRRRSEWNVLPSELFGEARNKLELGYELVVSGAFRRICTSAGTELNQVLIDVLGNSRIRSLPGSREVLMSWIKPIRGKEESVRRFEDEDAEPRRGPKGDRPASHRKPKRSHLVFESVTRQKDAIKQAVASGRSDLALRYADQLVDYQSKFSETSDAARSLCDVAMYAKRCGAHGVQLALTERAVGLLPVDGWSYAQLADAYLCVGRCEEASKAYDIAASYGQAEISRTGRADVLKVQGRLDEALREYETAVRDFPENVVARTGRADVLRAQGRLDEALAEYETSVRDFPESTVARNGRAGVLKALGRLDEALAGYETSVRDFPQDVVARTGRAEVLKAQGRLDEALREYETAVRDFPENVVARTGRAEVLKAQGRLDEALREYDAVVRDFPENVVARTGRAEVLKVQGHLDEALTEYETAVRDFPQDVVARNGRAEVLKAQGRLDEALGEYETAVRDFPQDVVVRSGRAEVLKAQGRLDEALGEYETAVRDFPQNVVARAGRAEVLKAQGRLDEALREYETAVRDFPQDVVVRSGRAEVLKSQGRLDEALREYETAVRDFPQNVVARTGRAEVLKAQGRLDEALREYETAVRDFPQNVVARTGRAEVLKAQGRLDETLKEYDAAVRDFPENVVARNGRAEVLKAQGRLDEALREYEATYRNFPENGFVRAGYASVLIMKERYAEALQLLRPQSSGPPAGSVECHMRGMIHLRTGDLQAAVRIFESGLATPSWYASHGYFRRGLALARLRLRQYSATVETLVDEIAPSVEILRIDAFGRLGYASRARAALDKIKDNKLPVLVLLRDELSARYLEPALGGAHSDEWLFARECDLLLAA